MDIYNKLKLANDMCGGIWCYDADNRFRLIYPFTTENISGYLPLFDLKDKSLLTVGSSGDQVINAILCGASNISVIDLCPFAKEYFYLKKAAIETFSRDEFLNFLGYYYFFSNKPNKNAFNKKDYLKLRDALATYDDGVIYFWDNLLMGHRNIKVRKRLFQFDEIPSNQVVVFNEYLKSDMIFNELKNKINNSSIYYNVGDIFSVSINKTFDNINLSNINDYYTDAKFKGLLGKMDECLNDNGQMLVAYLYPTSVMNIPVDFNMYSVDLKNDNKSLSDNVMVYKKFKKK